MDRLADIAMGTTKCGKDSSKIPASYKIKKWNKSMNSEMEKRSKDYQTSGKWYSVDKCFVSE